MGYPADQDDHDEQGVEEWIVSYADMITCILGFFVMMFSFSVLDSKKLKEITESFDKRDPSLRKIEKKVDQLDQDRKERALQMLISMLNLGDNLNEAIRKVEESFKKKEDARTARDIVEQKIAKGKDWLELKKTDDDKEKIYEIILPEKALFGAGEYELNSEARAKLRDLSADIRLMSQLVNIEVIGHSDSTPPGRSSPIKDNFTLSAARAGAVARELVRLGVRDDLVRVSGMGSLQPLVPERTKDGKLIPENLRKNRRVHIVLKRRVHEALSH